MADIPLRILMSATGSGGIVSAMSSITSAGLGVNKALLGVSLAAVGIAVGVGVTAVKAAADFQSQLTSLATGAGESQKNLKMVGDGILNLAVSTGTSTKSLTDGMYQIESAGYRGQRGLDVLAAAARGAKVGNADLGVVADATTTIMTDFSSKNVTASQAVNTLIATVSNGKTTMQQLSGALSQVLPTASAAKVGLTDTMGAMATMTGEGIPAANAATYLRQTIMSLDAPSAKTKTALQGIGLSSSQVSTEMQKSLPGALQMITDALSKKFKPGSAAYISALSNIAGGSKQMQGMLDLTGQHLQTFKGNVDSISGSVKQGGNNINGWSQVQGNFNQKMQQLNEVVQTTMIRLGQQLLPIVTQIAGGLLHLASIGGQVANFFQHNAVAMTALKIVAIAFLGAVIAPLVVAFYSWAVAAGVAAIATLAATWPILLIGAAIALLIAGIILAVQHWGQIAHFLQGVWTTVLNALKTAFSSSVAFIKGVFGGIGAFFSGIWKGIQQAFGNVGGWFQDRFKQAQNGMKSGWDNVTSTIHGVGQNIGNTFMSAAQNVVKAHQWMMAHNYYYHDAVVAIQNWTSQAKSFVTTQWQNVQNFIGSVWSGIKNAFSSAINFLTGLATSFWNAEVRGWTNIYNSVKGVVTSLWGDVSSAFSSAFNFIDGIATTFWNDEVQGWTNIYNRVVSVVSSMWSNVTSTFSNAWGSISGALSSLGSSISGWFSNLGNQALQWGENVVNMLAQGIMNAAGAVGNAVSSVASKITSVLGFHSPPESGPAADSDTWMPNMMRMLATGMLGSLPTLQSAINTTAGTIASGLSGLSGNARVGVSSLPGSGASASAGVGSALGGGQTTQNINLTLNINAQKLDESEMEQVARYTVTYFGDQIRSQFGSIAI